MLTGCRTFKVSDQDFHFQPCRLESRVSVETWRPAGFIISCENHRRLLPSSLSSCCPGPSICKASGRTRLEMKYPKWLPLFSALHVTTFAVSQPWGEGWKRLVHRSGQAAEGLWKTVGSLDQLDLFLLEANSAVEARLMQVNSKERWMPKVWGNGTICSFRGIENSRKLLILLEICWALYDCVTSICKAWFPFSLRLL